MTLRPDPPTRARVLRDFDTTLLLGAVAITFTEKAAGEMKLRLRAALEAAKSDEERERPFEARMAEADPTLLPRGRKLVPGLFLAGQPQHGLACLGVHSEPQVLEALENVPSRSSAATAVGMVTVP